MQALDDIMSPRARGEVLEGQTLFTERVWPMLKGKPVNVGKSVAAHIIKAIVDAEMRENGPDGLADYVATLMDSLQVLASRVKLNMASEH